METASWEVKIHYSTFRWNSCPACFIFLRSWSTIFVFRLINGGAVTFRNCEWLIRANQVGQLGRHFASFHPCCWMFMKLIDWRYYKKYKSILSSGVIEDSRPQIEFEFSFPLLLSSLHRSTTRVDFNTDKRNYQKPCLRLRLSRLSKEFSLAKRGDFHASHFKPLSLPLKAILGQVVVNLLHSHLLCWILKGLIQMNPRESRYALLKCGDDESRLWCN